MPRAGTPSQGTASLGLLFKHGRISKPIGRWSNAAREDEGSIDMPLGRLNAERGWWQKPDPEGQSRSPTESVGARRRSHLARARTGHRRTHQLRVHCAEMGWPIVVIIFMEMARASASRDWHLHSREIVIPISKNKDPCG